MNNRYNLYNLEALFRDHLLAGIEKTRINPKVEPSSLQGKGEKRRKELKKVSVKNYLSDFRHFWGWLIFKFKVQGSRFKVEETKVSEFAQLISPELVQEYKSYLLENNLPLKTVNRRLSTVRKFCSFCISQGWMKENPAKKIQNVKFKIKNDDSKLKIDSILDQFKTDLKKQNLDNKIITSYLDDVREFLAI